MTEKPKKCGDCPHWHRENNVPDWPWGNPFGSCDLDSEMDLLVDHDKPLECPLEEGYQGRIHICWADDVDDFLYNQQGHLNKKGDQNDRKKRCLHVTE